MFQNIDSYQIPQENNKRVLEKLASITQNISKEFSTLEEEKIKKSEFLKKAFGDVFNLSSSLVMMIDSKKHVKPKNKFGTHTLNLFNQVNNLSTKLKSTNCITIVTVSQSLINNIF